MRVAGGARRVQPSAENLQGCGGEIAIEHDTRSNRLLYVQCRCIAAPEPPDY
jgi:hypothetical protein